MIININYLFLILKLQKKQNIINKYLLYEIFINIYFIKNYFTSIFKIVKLTVSDPQNHKKPEKSNIVIITKDQQQNTLNNYEPCVLITGLDEKISKKDVQQQILKNYNIKGVGHIGNGVFLVFTPTEKDSMKIQKDLDKAQINGKKVKIVQMMKRKENQNENDKK